MDMQKDYFKHKAEKYEQEVARTNNVQNIANKITNEIDYTKNMEILDFGSGTGLLLSAVAPFVKKITAIDISESMNKVLQNKSQDIKCDIEILKHDLTKSTINRKFDGIISSMTIHHVEDVGALFEIFYDMLNIEGNIAIADLDLEDGSFHKEDTGVFHFGFDRNEFLDIAKKAGFKNLKIQTASIVKKPYGEYSVFLLTGKK